MNKLTKIAGLTAVATLLSGTAFAADTTLGVVLGFTGPLDTLSPRCCASAELAAKNINDQGGINGGQLKLVTGDDNCVTADMATAAATQVINDGAVGVIGGMCSGVTAAIANNVTVPNSVLQISPSATAATITTLEDKDLVFRTSPSDAYNSEVFAKALFARGVTELGITYVNNDYGKGLADNFLGGLHRCRRQGSRQCRARRRQGRVPCRARPAGRSRCQQPARPRLRQRLG